MQNTPTDSKHVNCKSKARMLRTNDTIITFTIMYNVYRGGSSKLIERGSDRVKGAS